MWQTTGFIEQKKIFQSLIDQDQLSHAYIFQGPEQIGKKLFAQDLSVLVNKREKFDLADPDLFMVAPRGSEGDLPAGRHGTKIYIEDIRDLKAFISLRPFYGPYQIVIVDDVHRLTPEASNAFLKLLEEPTGKVVFILVTSQPQELLPTISSRAQHISFLPHTDTVVASLMSLGKLSKTDQDLIIAIAQGRIGWAQSASQEGIKNLKESIDGFVTVLKSPLAERMLYAKTMFEKQPYKEQVEQWLSWAYVNKESIPNAHHVLTQLLMLHQYINQPQYNHRALLENTLINL